MITAQEETLDKSKHEREDRNNSSGSEEMPNVECTYVVMDESHSQTDHVGRTRLAKFCGSRDDSLSWNLRRVIQDDAIRADEMDHKTRQATIFLRNVNLSVRAMVLSTFYHNTLMKAQAQRLIVPENCDEYKRLWENLVVSSLWQ